MKGLFLLGMLSFQSLFASNLHFSSSSEHFEIACAEQDIEESIALLQLSEPLYAQLSQEYHYQFPDKIHVRLFPDITSLHQAIHREDAPDWWIINFGSPIQMVSPRNPGPYHSAKNLRKAFLKTLVEAFIYNKFSNHNAPWWLVTGVSAKRVDWPYHPLPSFYPKIQELEAATYGIPGMGWCAMSLTSYIETQYGKESLHKLLEDYSSFEAVLGLSKEELSVEWHAFLKKEMQCNGLQWAGLCDSSEFTQRELDELSIASKK